MDRQEKVEKGQNQAMVGGGQWAVDSGWRESGGWEYGGGSLGLSAGRWKSPFLP